jgi:hypothetical protein
VVAPPTAVAWALDRYYGIRLPHIPLPAPPLPLAAGSAPTDLPATFEMPKPAATTAPAPAAPAPAPAPAPPASTAPAPAKKKQKAYVVEDVFGEDTPIPQPVPMQDTGSIQRVPPMRLDGRPTRAPTEPPGRPTAESDAALAQALAGLEAAIDRDAVATTLVAYLARMCARAAFFVVRKGQLAGWIGTGLGVYADAVRGAVLPLDSASTFRDIIRTRLPFRGPVTDPASRDLLIEALGWAPVDMLAVPIAVREKVVGILYGDERRHPLPDEHLKLVSRAAETALERAVAARKAT